MNLILIELNEINFNAVNHYIEKGHSLNAFKKIIEKGLVNTIAESEYQNLEPWIQWPSVHNGKTFNDHKIYRLGDSVNSCDKQIFEDIESAGFRVGAISPMNATNRLKNPAYFIPDPWTKTLPDDSFLSKVITNIIVQAVNDNSKSKLSIKTIFYLGISFFALVSPSRYFPIAMYAARAFARPWRKALFLDMFLYEIHKTLFKRKSPNFSTLFLNAGAHIQHHYFFNSSYVDSEELKNPSWYIEEQEDPILEMLKIYDEILLDLLSKKNIEVIVATGLSQKPFEQKKFYYRLKNHALFLEKIGIEFTSVLPRMTRDFLISFETLEQASIAEKKLSKIYVNKKDKLFGEIDNRGKDIFVVLTFPDEVTKKTSININEKEILLSEHVTFVAIKNGEHDTKGYAYFSEGISKFAPSQNSHVSNIYNTIFQYYETIKNKTKDYMTNDK